LREFFVAGSSNVGLLAYGEGEISMKKTIVVKIAKQRCKGCGLCVDVCPKEVLRLSPHFNKLGYHCVEVAKEGCIGCRRCTVICPDACIELFLEEEEAVSSEVSPQA